MYFSELAVFLASFYSITGFFLHGRRDGLNFLFKKFNETQDLLFNSDAVQTLWIQQPLDHFDKNEDRTWLMRYFQRLDMWKPDGPMYLFINGEGEAVPAFLETGITFELAKETNGAIFSSEHRYYGKSKPFINNTIENIQFLSSRQALADNARLLEKIKTDPKFRSSKVVVVGGSYAGNLAAWMKLLYPDLVDAVISSSGPVLAKADFFEYLETVGDDFKKYGPPECIENIILKFKRYEELLKTDEGIKLLKYEETICDETDMHKPLNQQIFFIFKVGSFAIEAQYGSVETIKEYCDDIDSSKVHSSRDDEVSMWNDYKQCFDFEFEKAIEQMKTTDQYIWYYQSCTEFGYYRSSNSNFQPFTKNIPVEIFYKTCEAVYGPGFDEKRVEEGVLKSNEIYGGLKPNVTNVVFVNGELDPWHRLGVVEDISNDAPAKVIPFSSHCRDLFPDCINDPEELKEARKYIKNLIKKWIGAGEFVKIN